MYALCVCVCVCILYTSVHIYVCMHTCVCLALNCMYVFVHCVVCVCVYMCLWVSFQNCPLGEIHKGPDLSSRCFWHHFALHGVRCDGSGNGLARQRLPPVFRKWSEPWWLCARNAPKEHHGLLVLPSLSRSPIPEDPAVSPSSHQPGALSPSS